IRAYQRAKKHIVSQEDILSQPTLDSIQRDEPSYGRQFYALLEKSVRIGIAFDTSMEEALQEDEKCILAHQDHPAASVYFRLKKIVDPHIPEQVLRSSVFLNVYSGVGALPGTMEPLARHLAEMYLKKHKGLPGLKRLAELMS